MDGILISGHGLKFDESMVTGESVSVKKKPSETVKYAIRTGALLENVDLFILSGSKVMEGVGTFMVTTTTEVHSSYGRIMMSLRDVDITPSQLKYRALLQHAVIIGVAFTVYLLGFLLVKIVDTRNFSELVLATMSIISILAPTGLLLPCMVVMAFAILVLYRLIFLGSAALHDSLASTISNFDTSPISHQRWFLDLLQRSSEWLQRSSVLSRSSTTRPGHLI
jgi:Ca2+-transporting ATPase